MGDTLRFTLLAEGTSDLALLPLLTWLLRQHVSPDLEPAGQLVDKYRLPPGAMATDRDRLRSAVDVFPCDVLFLHRDADRETREARVEEINRWLADAHPLSVAATVAVIPIRTTEAWLLTDESAIRQAAGNRNGSVALSLPKPSKVEAEADPKATLLTALRVASERRGRRLKSFDAYAARTRIGECMADPSTLRELAAFRQLEADVLAVCSANDWK
jgi:hypothetical protein